MWLQRARALLAWGGHAPGVSGCGSYARCNVLSAPWRLIGVGGLHRHLRPLHLHLLHALDHFHLPGLGGLLHLHAVLFALHRHLLAEFLGLGILMGMRRYSYAVHRAELANEFLGVV